jgi:hypothetical protein
VELVDGLGLRHAGACSADRLAFEPRAGVLASKSALFILRPTSERAQIWRNFGACVGTSPLRSGQRLINFFGLGKDDGV